MSSFVIDKKEYVKAAGLIAGIVEAKKLWLYDYEYRRQMNAQDFYTRFVECFEMNALSVAEQYKDLEPETDLHEYKDEFFRCYQIGLNHSFEPDSLRSLVIALADFFRSSVYQVENYSYMFRMQAFFDRISTCLFSSLFPHEVTSWGSLA